MKLSREDCLDLINALEEWDDVVGPKELEEGEEGLDADRYGNLMSRLAEALRGPGRNQYDSSQVRENNRVMRNILDMSQRGYYPFHAFVDNFVSEPSNDGEHFIIRAIHHRAWEKGEADRPSTFVCECDFREVADIITDVLNENLVD